MGRLAVVTLSFGCAVFVAVYGHLSVASALGCGLLLVLLSPLTFWIFLRRDRRVRILLCIGLGLGLGLAWYGWYTQWHVVPGRGLDGTTVLLEGRVRQFPVSTAYGGYVVPVEISLEGGGRSVVRLSTDEQGETLRPGDRIRTIAHCKGTEETAPGVVSMAMAQGISLKAKAYGELTVQRPEQIPLRDWPAYGAQKVKQLLSTLVPPETGAQLIAIMTGDRSGLNPSFSSALSRTGLSHTVAVSGMHLSFFAGLIALLLGGRRRLASLVLIPACILFALGTGSPPSIVRAAVMMILLHLAPLLGRERDSATGLGAALVLLLLANPYQIAHVGLQLSFTSVAGILWVGDPLYRSWIQWVASLEGRRFSPLVCPVLTFVGASLSTTVGASVFTIPLNALYFQSISLIAPLSNLLTLWAVALLFLSGLALTFLGWVCPPVAMILAWPVSWLSQLFTHMVYALSSWPFASVTTQWKGYLLWLCYLYSVIVLSLAFRGKKRVILPVCSVVITLCLTLLLSRLEFWKGKVSLTLLDVGQGQSVLVRSGNFLSLVDCGGEGGVRAGDVAADYLQDRGIGRIHLLVLTHYHGDHANGIGQLFQRLQIDGVALPDVDPDNPLRKEIEEAGAREGSQIYFVTEDLTVDLGEGQSITLFAPLGQGSTNEEGLTYLLETEEMTALITGDMGADVEQRLVYHGNLPPVDVLVAGHHGSRYSSSQLLLDRISPEYGLISVGEGNVYGHPAPETLERLALYTQWIYRTDEFGTITIRSRSGRGTTSP